MGDVPRLSAYIDGMNPPTNRVRVVLLTQAIGPLDYRLPAGMEAGPGCVVMVPLGPRKLPGVIWDDDVFGDEAVDASKLRPVLELVDCPPLGQGLRRLVNWVADYYLTSHAAVLRMVLASSAAFTVSGTIVEYRRTGFEPARLTPQRAAALDALEGAQGLVRELAAEAGVSDAVIRGLIKAGAFEPVTISVDSPLPEPIADFGAPKLNDAQMVAADAMVAAVRSGGFDTFVLDGVTGSGKTETYFEAVAEAIRLGKQVLVLLPEIALTAPFLARFEARNAQALTMPGWELDLPYGRHAREVVDVHSSDTKALGTVVYFHAGYWQSRDKSQFRFLAPAFNAMGWDMALVNYPLCPDVRVADIVASAAQALQKIATHQTERGRTGPIVLCGHSAGAHLAIELALQQVSATAPLPISGVVAISGVYDLQPLLDTTLNTRLQLDANSARACSPTHRVRPGATPAAGWVRGPTKPPTTRVLP